MPPKKKVTCAEDSPKQGDRLYNSMPDALFEARFGACDLFLEFFVAGVAELHALCTAQQGLIIILSIPKLGMIGVAGNTSNPALFIHWHVQRDGHAWGNINRMGKAAALLFVVAWKVLVTFAADITHLFSIDQLVSIKW